MIVPMARITFAAFALLMASLPATVHAQDVPGIEICTVEKTMERRTSCLQSNVDFLQKTITKLTIGPSAEDRCRQPADRGAEGRGHWLAEARQRDAGGAEQGGGRREEGRNARGEGCCACREGCRAGKEGAK